MEEFLAGACEIRNELSPINSWISADSGKRTHCSADRRVRASLL